MKVNNLTLNCHRDIIRDYSSNRFGPAEIIPCDEIRVKVNLDIVFNTTKNRSNELYTKLINVLREIAEEQKEK